jgi:hypothetical protein
MKYMVATPRQIVGWLTGVGGKLPVRWASWKKTNTTKFMKMNVTCWSRTGIRSASQSAPSDLAEVWVTNDYLFQESMRKVVCGLLKCDLPSSGLPVKYVLTEGLDTGSRKSMEMSKVVRIESAPISSSDFVLPPGLVKVHDFFQVVATPDATEIFFQVRDPTRVGK